ncbi:YwqG family protein [Rhodopseudomonas sp. P2A-2r]|uniref:YwqG family protein n=1 Tax=Rhodopseudomonas sp. P2A-2r TaxID=2991972 RepID=UPI0022349F8C|nr:YwqG family protein [Rhodopseudomonas sp. P2A-2r]UZE48601.1 YwqG family protein [Rhodopseudomonas sp. P2A-2r]
MPLLQHPDVELRYTAALQFRDIDPQAFRTTLTALSSVGGEVGANAARMLAAPPLAMPVPIAPLPADHPIFWPARHPPPAGMARDEIERRISALIPDQPRRLLQLLRPAMGLWPQAPRDDAPPHGSRLGGMPHAPPGWTWPVEATEPMLFIGQINCADICHLPGAEVLPSSGVLAFFGDHDTVNGCMFSSMGGAVYHWPDTSQLAPAVPPMLPLTVFPRAELLFRPLLQLPDPKSRLVESILKDDRAFAAYEEFYSALESHGLPEGYDYAGDFGAMLGWPRLVQNDDWDFLLDRPSDDYRLLLQLPSYTNGEEFADWGPGGTLYYFIPEEGLEQQDWQSCELAGQFT